MARHARSETARRRQALYLVAITFVFGCVSSLWGAQAASADVTASTVTSVTTLVGTTVFISNDVTVPVQSVPELTTIPGTTVSLPDLPAATPTVEQTAPTVLVVPTRPPPDATAPGGRGELTFTSSRGCDSAGDYSAGKLKTYAQAYVEYLLAQGWSIRLSCLETGHSEDVHGTNRRSLHTIGQAFDIDQINGEPVSPTSVESNRFYRWLKAQPNTSLPWEVGGPHVPSGRSKLLRNQGQTGGPFFTNSGHREHWHFGFKADTGTYPDGSVAASMVPDRKPAPTTPQTPAFVLPPPLAKEEPVVTPPAITTPDQPDPNGDPGPGSDVAPDQSAPAAPPTVEPVVPVDIPPVTDAPSVTPSEAPTVAPVAPAEPAPNLGRQAISIDPVQLQADYDRLKADGVLPVVQQIASDNNIPFAVALGLVSRETHGRNELGDSGHGHCYLQIDDRAHGDWLANHDWRDPAQCFGFGLGILNHDLFLHDGNMLEALAAYNSGNGNVHKALHRGLSPEAYTAHANYASDVLARADFYYKMLDALPTVADTRSATNDNSSAAPVALPPSEVQQ